VLRTNHRCKDGALRGTRPCGAPVGKWELAFDDEQTKHMFEKVEIEDTLFVATYFGTTPEWPA
jgi:hypothetical protein